MGCDIHGYIEYKRWPTLDTPYCLFSGRLGDRDYSMFGLLAGVRQDGCMFEPRGIPKDISRTTLWEYGLFVSKEEGADGEDRTCSVESANKWVARGDSVWLDKNLVSSPDWHTPSYVSTEEFEQVIQKRKEMEWGYSEEWDAILAAMKALPDARFVFWFDN